MPTYICDLHFSGIQISYLKVEGKRLCALRGGDKGAFAGMTLPWNQNAIGLEKCHKLSYGFSPDPRKSPQISKVSLMTAP